MKKKSGVLCCPTKKCRAAFVSRADGDGLPPVFPMTVVSNAHDRCDRCKQPLWCPGGDSTRAPHPPRPTPLLDPASRIPNRGPRVRVGTNGPGPLVLVGLASFGVVFGVAVAVAMRLHVGALSEGAVRRRGVAWGWRATPTPFPLRCTTAADGRKQGCARRLVP